MKELRAVIQKEGCAMKLPAKVQRLSDSNLVDPKTLAVGDRFALEGTAWKVVSVEADGIDCVVDHTFFFFRAPSKKL